MANLITEKQKKIIKVDYYFRLSSISLLIPISLLGLFLLAYIVPYYVSVSRKNHLVDDQFKSVISVENKENIGKNVTQIANQLGDELQAVEIFNKKSLMATEYFNKIIENKNPNIQITRLSFNSVQAGQAEFTVNGNAKSREGLVNFIDDLKFKGGFTGVEAPISDFANGTNISFTLNIKKTI